MDEGDASTGVIVVVCTSVLTAIVTVSLLVLAAPAVPLMSEGIMSATATALIGALVGGGFAIAGAWIQAQVAGRQFDIAAVSWLADRLAIWPR